jgi:hypothetical protein
MGGTCSDDVRRALCEHIRAGRRVVTGFFDNGDFGFEIADCRVNEKQIFVHMKFATYGLNEKLKIMSAHPQRWGY